MSDTVSAEKGTVTQPSRRDAAHGRPAAGGPMRALAVVLLATFMNQFDVTGVNVAIPDLQQDLHAGAAAAQWVLAGYTLPFALLLVTGGRLGDLVGRRRVFLVGAAGFTLGAVLAGTATSVPILVAARLVQGMAAAMMGPQVLAVLQTLVPPARRGPAMGLYAAVIGLASVAGPIVCGVMVGTDLFGWGWRWAFLVNVPVGLVAVLGGLRYLDESSAPDGHRLDLGGVGLATVALVLLLAPLTYGRELGWPWWAWAALVASAPALALLVAHQRRRERRGQLPLIALHLFGQRVFTAGVLTTFNLAALMTGFFFVFVAFLQYGQGFSPSRAGQSLLPWALGTTVASFVAIPLAKRHGRRVLVGGGLLSLAGMTVLLATITAAGDGLTVPLLVPGLVVFGVGVTFVTTPVLNVTLSGIARQDAGSASGVFSTFRQAGAAFGVALTGGVFYGVLGDRASATSGDYGHAMVVTTLVLMALAAATLALVFLLPRSGRPASGAPGGQGGAPARSTTR